MSKLDDIITVLPCLALNKHNCGGCPYNPKLDRNWPYGCVRGQEQLVRDTIAMLKVLKVDDKHDVGESL